jgi:uncharacterized protein YbjQ (UPF0145 family)
MTPRLPFDPKLIVTTDTIPGYEIVASLGVAEGYGTYLYPALTEAGRRQSLDELIRSATLDLMNNALAHDAQGIVGMRYLALPDGGLLMYGTAVTIRAAEPIRVWGPSIRQ